MHSAHEMKARSGVLEPRPANSRPDRHLARFKNSRPAQRVAMLALSGLALLLSACAGATAAQPVESPASAGAEAQRPASSNLSPRGASAVASGPALSNQSIESITRL